VEGVLSGEISEVRVSRRLTDSPACLVASEAGMHAHIERLMRAQGRQLPTPTRTLEINPSHPLIGRLDGIRSQAAKGPAFQDWVHLIHDQALLAEGSPIADPQGFARRMSRLMNEAMPQEPGEEAHEG